VQNVEYVQNVRHACKMWNAKCQIWVQNVKDKCEMSSIGAKYQTWV